MKVATDGELYALRYLLSRLWVGGHSGRGVLVEIAVSGHPILCVMTHSRTGEGRPATEHTLGEQNG